MALGNIGCHGRSNVNNNTKVSIVVYCGVLYFENVYHRAPTVLGICRLQYIQNYLVQKLICNSVVHVYCITHSVHSNYIKHNELSGA